MSDNNMNGKDFLLGAIVGGVIGAVTALLLAPKTGKELRSDISEQYQNVSEKTQKIAADVSSKTKVIASNVSEKSHELAEKAKEVVSNVTDELKTWKASKQEQAEVATSAEKE